MELLNVDDEIGVLVSQLPIDRVQASEDAAKKKAATPVPTDFEIVPYPIWETDFGTFVTDDLCQKDCVAYFDGRRTKMVIDYEHQTTKGVEAPAAGWVPRGGMYAAKERGLRARNTDWLERGRGYVERREYDHISPVALYNKNTKRIFAILSIALTNTPATQNQTPLSEQIAARALAEYATVMAKGGTNQEGGYMKELLSSFRYTLGLKLTDTIGDMIASLEKILAALKGLDSKLMIVQAKGDGDEDLKLTADDKRTLADLLGLSAAAPTGSVAAAAPAVLDILGLAPDADVETVSAKILELKHPADMVPRAELEAVQARLVEQQTQNTANEVDQIIQAGQATGQVTTALEPDVRAYYKAHGGEATRKLVAKLPVQKPRQIAGDEPARAPDVSNLAAKVITIRGGAEIPVDPQSELVRTKVSAIQRESPEKFGDYATARRELMRREAAAE